MQKVVLLTAIKRQLERELGDKVEARLAYNSVIKSYSLFTIATPRGLAFDLETARIFKQYFKARRAWFGHLSKKAKEIGVEFFPRGLHPHSKANLNGSPENIAAQKKKQLQSKGKSKPCKTQKPQKKTR